MPTQDNAGRIPGRRGENPRTTRGESQDDAGRIPGRRWENPRTTLGESMGHLFKYIADTIVANTAIADTSCPGCQESVPVFPIEASPEQEEWDDSEGVEELCAKCLRSIPLRKLETRDQEMKIQQWINQHYPKGTLRGDERLSKFVGICDEFRRTASATNFVVPRPSPSSSKVRTGPSAAATSPNSREPPRPMRNRFASVGNGPSGTVSSPPTRTSSAT